MSNEIEKYTPQTTKISLQASSNDVELDYQLARDNMKTIIADTKTAIDELMTIASSSQNHKVYEVLAMLLTSAADMNNKLMHINKQYKDIAGAPEEGDTNITNNLYITTAELQKMIKGNSEVKVIDQR